MIALDTVSRGEFEACLHEIFSIVASDGKFPLELAQVRPCSTVQPGAKREPFAVIFKASQAIRLPQGIYKLENQTLGLMDIFLVQTSETEVEAVFN